QRRIRSLPHLQQQDGGAQDLSRRDTTVASALALDTNGGRRTRSRQRLIASGTARRRLWRAPLVERTGNDMDITKTTRRSVTGHDADGKAIAIFDGPVISRQRSPGGNAVTMLWVTSESPALTAMKRAIAMSRGG